MTENQIPLKTRSGFMVWKLAVAEASMLAYLAGWFAFVTAVANLNWSALEPMDKFIIIGGVVAVMVSNAVAFLNKTVAKTENEQKQKLENQP